MESRLHHEWFYEVQMRSSPYGPSSRESFPAGRADLEIKRAALPSGAPTAENDHAMKQALREDRWRAAETRARVAAIDSNTAGEIKATAAGIASQVHARLVEAAAGLGLPPGPVPEVADNMGLSAAIEAMATAAADVQVAEGILATASGAYALVLNRLGEKEAAQADIIDRRLRDGKIRDDTGDERDGAALSQIASDIAGLEALRERAGVYLVEMKARAVVARQTLATARHQVRHAENTAFSAMLHSYASGLADRLEAALEQIEDVRTTTGRRPEWFPSKALHLHISRAAAAGGFALTD